ncbi:hypothetical protein [Methylopila sp. M107]|uniref:hypothetical protein n=1 Tax=Methylopila sp. M107 TaxID=1101190 RepID=UPI00037BA999|nr:hypothetical protein [Methylopila sp. M107]
MVKFIAADVSMAEFHKLGFDGTGVVKASRADSRMKSTAFTYQSGASDYDRIAGYIAAHFGDFSDCLAFASSRALGDFTNGIAVRPDWIEYAAGRARHGAAAPLDLEPGHRFGAGEGAELRQLIRSALSLGWDMLLKADTTKTVVRLSHDDRIELYYLSSPAELKAKLAETCEPALWFDPRRHFS